MNTTSPHDHDTVRLERPSPAEQQLLETWLTDYISRPHPNLGRQGPVCPFVAPARRAGAIDTVAARWDTTRAGRAATSQRLHALVAASLERFRPQLQSAGNPKLQALVVMIGQLAPDEWHLLDEVHARAKLSVMQQGLMLGQFHPHCAAPAAHNRHFPVNRAPLPLLVVRRMAHHDHLFAETSAQMTAYLERHQP